MSLNPLPYQYLRKMVAGPEAETSGSKLWQAGKKRKGKGVSNSANYGITIPGRGCSKVQSLPKSIWVHMVIWPARSTELSPAQLWSKCITFFDHIGPMQLSFVLMSWREHIVPSFVLLFISTGRSQSHLLFYLRLLWGTCRLRDSVQIS